MEMEKVRQEKEDSTQSDSKEEGGSTPRDIHVLVGQHVSEIDALELHWQSEIEQLKAKQKASYRELVVDFFHQEMEMTKLQESGPTPEEESQSSEPNLLVKLARPLRPSPQPSSEETSSDACSLLFECLGLGGRCAVSLTLHFLFMSGVL